MRPATLRGLGPDQVLVLVNGKRRHQSALVHLNSSIGRGSTGVDLNAIPLSAIDHIEILRDGAAAQYGSDAIAGVINIVLKGGVMRPEVTSNAGLSAGSFVGNSCTPNGQAACPGSDIDFADGGLFDVGGSWGFAAGKGSVTIASEYRGHNRTNRASFDPRDQIVAGDAGHNAVAEPNHRWGDPDTRDTMTFVNANVPLNHAQTQFIYAFGGYSRRAANSAGFYRRALDARNHAVDLPARLSARDRADRRRRVGNGGRARRDREVDLRRERRVRAQFVSPSRSATPERVARSEPAADKTTFDAGSLALHQFVGNVDVSRPVAIGELAGRSTSPSAPSIAARTTRFMRASRIRIVTAARRISSATARRSDRRCSPVSVRPTRSTRRATASPVTSTWKATSFGGCGSVSPAAASTTATSAARSTARSPPAAQIDRHVSSCADRRAPAFVRPRSRSRSSRPPRRTS